MFNCIFNVHVHCTVVNYRCSLEC